MKDEISPQNAYALAREAGVSYEAAVRQLTNLKIVNASQSSKLLKVRPLKIKTEIGWGKRPLNGTANVWPVDEHWNEQKLQVHIDDEVVISLPENRSTGYRWFIKNYGSNDVKEESAVVAGDDYITARTSAASVRTSTKSSLNGTTDRLERRARLVSLNRQHRQLDRLETTVALSECLPLANTVEPMVGATGRRILRFRFHRSGATALFLQHQSAYSTNTEPIEQYYIEVSVKARRQGMSFNQLLDEHYNNEPVECSKPHRTRYLDSTSKLQSDASALKLF